VTYEKVNIKRGKFFIPCQGDGVININAYTRDISDDLQKVINILQQYPAKHVYHNFAEKIMEIETTLINCKVDKNKWGFEITAPQDCTIEYLIL